MAMADKIAVMNNGVVEQVATPKAIGMLTGPARLGAGLLGLADQRPQGAGLEIQGAVARGTCSEWTAPYVHPLSRTEGLRRKVAPEKSLFIS